MIAAHAEASAIHALAAEERSDGFRLLLLREFEMPDAPPAFAVIEQYLFRKPLRESRHGFSFGVAFLPEIVAWMSGELGRPALHDADGQPFRNPRWPVLCWQRARRNWPEDPATREWSADVSFPEREAWMTFRKHWSARLAGRPDTGMKQPNAVS